MNIEQMVCVHFDSLTRTDREVWKYIWRHKKECEKSSITEIAQACGVSPGAVTRLMKKIGLEGFTEFKIALRWQNREASAIPLNLQGWVESDYLRTLEMLRYTDFSPMFEYFEKAKRIFVYGTGEIQRHAAEEFRRQFMYPGRHRVHVVDGLDDFEMVSRLMKPDDVLLAISLSGENQEANQEIQKIKEQGHPLLTITGVGYNTLARMSDFNLSFSSQIMIKTAEGHRDHYSSSTVFLVVETMLAQYVQFINAKEPV